MNDDKGALYLGIDLGTTNSAAAIFDGAQITLVRNSQGGPLTPSVVRIDSRGGVTVGARARRFLESDPKNTRTEFKRLMGTAAPLEFPAAKLGKRPEELAAEVLRSLRADVQDQFAVLPQRAVISVPALFELPQSAATAEAALLAGFERVELIQEPIASALAAGWTAETAGYWLVYDLGGGTFDASLLETEEGLLRVVGHDGDNFLGGRDFDWAIVDWITGALAREQGVTISRADPQHGAAVRRLKHAAEEAKIELGRQAEAPISVPELVVDGTPVEVDLTLTQATLAELCAPLIARSIEVCHRLCQAHGTDRRGLSRIVLVGGPTMMPALRRQVAQSLNAPITEGLDPMTLVAQGAAIYAATTGLDARPARPAAPAGHRLWLQHPAMSSDLQPHVVGRLLQGGSGAVPASLRLVRQDGLFSTPAIPLDAEGAFVTAVELLPRRPNVFRIEGQAHDGAPVTLDPAALTIVQGLTISDPPLSRTIGVALANDYVRVYFERGAPLPARRTFTHHTVESVAQNASSSGSGAPGTPGASDFALKVPIVQGEFEHAHLCRLVGTLEIESQGLRQSLPAGSPIELTLSVDRGGQLFARALVPATGEVFEHVAHLLVPEASPESLAASIAAVEDRLAGLRGDAFRRKQAPSIGKLDAVDRALSEASRDVAAARGGDTDAAQKARRSLLEIDAMLEEAETEKRWPELEDKARQQLAGAAGWVAQYGTQQEQRLLDEVAGAVEAARQKRQPAELERQLRLVRRLSSAAFYRAPGAWEQMFETAAADADNATDIVAAQALVRDGRRALEQGDKEKLRRAVEGLWKLLPTDPEARRLSYESGVR